MLGILLYEGFEILYYTGKLGYTLTKGIYSISMYYIQGTSHTEDCSGNGNDIHNEEITTKDIHKNVFEKLKKIEKEQKEIYEYLMKLEKHTIEEKEDTKNSD